MSADRFIVGLDNALQQGDMFEFADRFARGLDDRAVVARAFVDQATVADLRRIARDFGWDLGGGGRDEIGDRMVEHYGDVDSTAVALATLDPDDRRLLALLACIPLATFETVLYIVPLFIARLPEGWLERPVDQSRILALAGRGAVFVIDAAKGGPTIVPSGFARALDPPPLVASAGRSDLVPAPSPEPLAALISTYQIVEEMGPLTSESSSIKRSWAYRGNWPTSSEGGRTMSRGGMIAIPTILSDFPDAVRGRVRMELGEGEVGEAAFYLAIVRRFLDAAAVISSGLDHAAQWGDLEADDFDADDFDGDDFEVDCIELLTGMPPEDRQRFLLALWRLLPYGSWDELSLASRLGSEARPARSARNPWYTLEAYDEGLGGWRANALDSLRWLLPSQGGSFEWMDATSYLELLRDAFPYSIMLPVDDDLIFLVDDRGEPLDGSDEGAWDRGLRQAWEAMITGPLRWLGMVEIARDGKGGLVALRPTFMAQAILSAGGGSAEVEGAPLRWEADLTVSVVSGAFKDLVAVLARCAEPAGIVDSRFHYRFTAASAGAAFSAGIVPADIHGAFAAADLPFPDEAAEALERWREGWGHVHRYSELALIEVNDPMLMEELLADQRTAKHIVVRCGPTTAGIRSGAVDEVVAGLEKRGYRPKVVEGGT